MRLPCVFAATNAACAAIPDFVARKNLATIKQLVERIREQSAIVCQTKEKCAEVEAESSLLRWQEDGT